MLYIFLVESGSTMTFDMNLALQTVANLKKAIAKQCQIAEEKQVLLISGGESLSATARVCSYGCSGTDTSPIFLFSKESIESENPPKCVTEYDADVDMTDRVKSCVDMNPSIHTVVARAEMAQQLYEMAKQQFHNCERLVHDQHLQQQGWASVVANLEDITNSFSNSAVSLEKMFNQFIEDKLSYSDLLQNFDGDMNTLSKIPLLPSLTTSVNTSYTTNNETQESMNLLEWISQRDNQNSLDLLFDHCRQGLDQLDSEQLSRVTDEVKKVMDSCNNSNMKEVKGLEERLSGLEKLMCDSKLIVNEQRDLAHAFYQNQTRAANLRDPSILPDLCTSHQQQLQEMLKNHQKLRDIRRRCARSKEELSANLHTRLRWILIVEKNLSEVDSKVLIYGENIRRLKKHLEVVRQIHLAPKIYLASVVEVVRRKTFSDVFLRWATSLAEDSSKLVENEIELRQTFSTQMESHFLRLLFPGMNEFPPRFANESPVPFDMDLPNLTESDVEFLRKQLPDLCDLLSVPSPVPMPQPSAHKVSTVGPNASKGSESDTEEYETVNEDFDNKSGNDNKIELNEVFTQMSFTAKDLEEMETNFKNITIDLKDKTNENNELQVKYDKLKNDLNLSEDTVKSLRKVSFESISSLKVLKLSFVEQYCDLRNQYLSSFESMKEQLNNWLLMKDNDLSDKEIELKRCLDEKTILMSDLQNTKLLLNNEIDSLKQTIDTLSKDSECLNRELNDKKCEINDLKTELIENKKALSLEHELEMTSLNEEMDSWKDLKQSLDDSLNEKINEMKAMQQNYEKLESDLLLRCQEEKDSLKNTLNDNFNEREETMKNEFENKIKEMEKNNESIVNELRSEMDNQKTKSLAELKERLDAEHRHEMDSLRHRFKLAISTTSIERTPSETSLEKVNLDLIDQLAQEREVQKLKQLIVDEKNRYEDLLIKSKKNREDELKAMRSEIAAKCQVNFNEALESISNEKDCLVQQMAIKDNCLQSAVSAINDIISRMRSENSETSESQMNEMLSQIEVEIRKLNSNYDQKLNESIICDTRSSCNCNSANMIKEKDLEISRLTHALRDSEICQSSTSAVGRIERVSVLGCEVGDIVLIYYEEKFSNYIVFTLNNVLHFLHTDCLDALSLRSVTGEAPQRWTIAEVTDKEYCQAKKAQNRYRVALNTKFYRVKAKPWTRFTNLMTRSTIDSRSTSSPTVPTPPMSVSLMSASVVPVVDIQSPDEK